MVKILVEEFALDSIKAMALRLQEERDEAMALLSALEMRYCEAGPDMTRELRAIHRKTLISVREFFARCNSSPKVME